MNDYGKVIYFKDAVAGLEFPTAGVVTWEGQNRLRVATQEFPRADGTIEFVTRMTPQVNNYGSRYIRSEDLLSSSTSQ